MKETMTAQEQAHYEKQAALTTGALQLHEHAMHHCPHLKGWELMKHHELVDMINRFDGDLYECEAALTKVNAIMGEMRT